MFDPRIVNGRRRYICFAVNRCFDTVVDDHLVAANSVHGIAFRKLYKDRVFTPEGLNSAIQNAIKGNPSWILLTKDQKPEGNLKRYEAGAYANLPINDDLNYLLLGLSYFDSNLNAHTTKEDFVIAVQRMIESFDKEAQGYPVLMPIIGVALSRTDLKEQDALEYIIEAFKINRSKITSDVYIVIHRSAKGRVSIADL